MYILYCLIVCEYLLTYFMNYATTILSYISPYPASVFVLFKCKIEYVYSHFDVTIFSFYHNSEWQSPPNRYRTFPLIAQSRSFRLQKRNTANESISLWCGLHIIGTVQSNRIHSDLHICWLHHRTKLVCGFRMCESTRIIPNDYDRALIIQPINEAAVLISGG